jgi:ABC-type Mn2+/Zn2+ transport system permease subunit
MQTLIIIGGIIIVSLIGLSLYIRKILNSMFDPKTFDKEMEKAFTELEEENEF